MSNKVSWKAIKLNSTEDCEDSLTSEQSEPVSGKEAGVGSV